VGEEEPELLGTPWEEKQRKYAEEMNGKVKLRV
jgi:hypothetical protein